MNKKMRVEIHDTTTRTSYEAHDAWDCIDEVDRLAYSLAVQHGETITIGHTIARPIRKNNNSANRPGSPGQTMEGMEMEIINDYWEKEYECPRCSETLAPEEVETKSWGRSCPKCGLDDHPVFEAMDRLENE